MFRDKKEEESGEFGAYTNLDKTMVIQEAQAFNETPLNYRKCNLILTKLLYLLYQSEVFTAKEATNVFFMATKAFQCKDSGLRRMTYLVIKELAGVAQDIIMVTSSLTQDINSKDSDILLFRGNALRVLGKVIDPSMIPAVERFFKQALVEKEAGVVSSALITAAHFYGENKEAIRRWVGEVQQALIVSGPKSLVQYHALGLLYLIKQGDRMDMTKLIQQLNKSSTNPMAVCLFLRMYAQLLAIDPATMAAPMDLKPFLRQSGPRSEMVALEAARIICERSKDVYSQDVVYAVTTLQVLLGSAKPVVKFAALRIINDLASLCPAKLAPCNAEIEGLVTHGNRNVATLAITALLKTGEEGSVDRLIKQIRGYIGEISDDFRIVVVEAVRALCLKFPSKQAGLLDFLGSILRDEGALDYKQAVVDAIVQLLERVPGALEPALTHLCEFIEDSEYAQLTIQILHVLGSQGARMQQPSKLIRYIYNRLVLEDAPVRVAAVGALIRFAVALPHLQHGIASILRRCLSDPDDYVRDRAVVGLAAMKAPTRSAFLADAMVPDLELLEQSLLEYTEGRGGPLDIDGLPQVSQAELFEQARLARSQPLVATSAGASSPTAGPAGGLAGAEYAAPAGLAFDIASVPELASLGPVFKSTPVGVALTEADTEYGVFLRKHVVPGHVILQFVCSNTVPGLLLSDVQVAVTAPAGFQPFMAIPISRLGGNETGSAFVVLRLLQGGPAEGSFGATLHFRSQECDPESGEPLEAGYQDKYGLESFEVSIADFVADRTVLSLESDWANLTEQDVQTFTLPPSIGSVAEALAAVIRIYGLTPASPPADPSSPTHTLLMFGEMMGGDRFAIRCRMAMSRAGVTLELAVKASAAPTVALLMDSLA